MNARTFFWLAILTLAAPASADEIQLKDGTKIIGTIVGFEDNSFKVQTSYGFALVRKDRIAAIIPSAEKPEAKKEAAPEKKKPPAPAAIPASRPQPAGHVVEPGKPPSSVANVSPGAAPAALPPAATSSAPIPSPGEALPPMREEVQGNLYINHTYGFRMYKPPGWQVIEGAQRTMPTAIVAMGTADETTLLVVGREPLKESLEAHAAATQHQLREIYENYRSLSVERTRLAGLPAIERRFRGAVDEHDWSGVVISLARANQILTILGVTSADSDLIQIQENIIARTIASLEFTLPNP